MGVILLLAYMLPFLFVDDEFEMPGLIIPESGGFMKDSKSILFVDDEEDILDVLVDLFADEGYDLHTATKAEDAMAIVDRHAVDFVLSDLKLPDGSGSDFLDHVRQKMPDSVRVLTSGYLDVQFGQVRESEVDGTLYLSKPWDILTLKQLVMERLG